ncbi:type II secretion system protein [Halorarum salinum]|uniref:Type II secretion system protein n=1 Tax=Halorarum salinum TaxID=2743089 RepID=A0A7D5QB99_9EURY|nr:type II secretion system protein [Halobaculum salinum]QLG62997.1 type II secretion system protein [Halobaculum salinum]
MLRRLATVWPFPIRVDADLRRSLGVLNVSHPPEFVLGAGYVTATVLSLAVWIALVSALGASTGSALAVAFGIGSVRAVEAAPGTLAAFRRTRALSDALELVGMLALRMRLMPVPERAARFAARSGEGILARSLRDHVERSVGTPRTGLNGFTDEWSPWFPALDRATAGLLAAAEANPERRDRILDRTVRAVDTALSERVASFAGELRGPVTGLYAFGVLLPLALVGALPAATAAGVPVTPAAFVLVYDLLLPFSLAVGSVRLLAARPVAFQPPAVEVDRGSIVDGRVLAAVAGGGAAGVAWFASGIVLDAWASSVAAVGVGVGTSLVVLTRPVVRERRRVRELERGLPDALSAVGRAVADGEAVETAIARAGARTPGRAGGAFREAARRQRLLGVGVRDSFLGRSGPFADEGGTRTRAAVSLLAVAAREGKPAGEALCSHADRLDELLERERDGRRSLAAVTRTLVQTGALFGPLVGGATVALARRLATAGGGLGPDATAPPLPPELVGSAVGCYVLLLATLLTGLATGLERGIDAALIAYRVGIALVTAVGSFLVGVLGAGLLL